MTTTTVIDRPPQGRHATPGQVPGVGASEPGTRTCRTCGEKFGRDQLVKSASSPGGVLDWCNGCRTEHRRRQEAFGGIDTTNRAIDAVPDPQPAVHLRESLARHRSAGMPFEPAFRAAVPVALRDLPPKERGHWRLAFEQTTDAWRAAYHREGPRLALFIADDA